MLKKVFYGIMKGYDMLYIQLNKKDAILNMLERLRFSRSIYLNGATIDRVGNIPDNLNGYNIINVSFTCSLLKVLGKKYSEYQRVFYECKFSIKDNTISYDNDTAGNIIKELVDIMVDD